jgi:hypothetical protein
VSDPSPIHRVPSRLLRWISDRAAELENEAEGHVLRIGLGGVPIGSRSALRAALGSRPIDSIVSVAALAETGEPGVLLEAVAGALGDEGRFLFLEPELGFGHVARLAARFPWRATFGLSGEVGVPGRIRKAGLQVVMVRRLAAPTIIPPYRDWVMGTAIVALPLPTLVGDEVPGEELQTTKTEVT